MKGGTLQVGVGGGTQGGHRAELLVRSQPLVISEKWVGVGGSQHGGLEGGYGAIRGFPQRKLEGF